jgi:Sigma-70 factor, region 1.1/Sigma-70 factor, region 1.2
MATKIKMTPQREEMLEKERPETALLDLSAAVKDLIRSAKKRGYVTHNQINALLSSQEAKSEQIKDILAKFSEIGVDVVETKEAELEEEVATREEPEEEGESELAEVQQRSIPAKSGAKDPAERTDDPVRMYLHEMGSKELLSREGEIAIAKRIEAGREAMIAGLCESPLTFQAIIIWRDELNEGKVFLRDVIDLDATSAGSNAKAMPAPLIGPDAAQLPLTRTPRSRGSPGSRMRRSSSRRPPLTCCVSFQVHRPISSLSSTLSCERPANYVPQNMLSYLGCGMDSTMSRAPTTPKRRSLNISQSTRSMLTEGRWLAAQRLSAVRSISSTV